jgi:hypothetical protein
MHLTTGEVNTISPIELKRTTKIFMNSKVIEYLKQKKGVYQMTHTFQKMIENIIL